jgi:hypothetical protein
MAAANARSRSPVARKIEAEAVAVSSNHFPPGGKDCIPHAFETLAAKGVIFVALHFSSNLPAHK